MYTIFSCPKEFTSLFGIIQRNAIKSWLNLRPKPNIILFGIENEEIKKEFNDDNITFLPIEFLNEYNTPYISKIFETAMEVSKTETLCYVNSDIILFSDFSKAVINLKKNKNYFGVGRRYDIEIKNFIEFNNLENLQSDLINNCEIDSYTGSDYFIFKNKSIKQIPNFLIGRTCWDNWLIYNAFKNNLNLVDCSNDISCIHQKHDYSHIKTNTKSHYKGLEREKNLRELGGYDKIYDIRDCRYFLKNGLIKKNNSIKSITHGILRKTKYLLLKEIIFQRLKRKT